MKTQVRAIILVVICTLFAAAGQMLYKLGSYFLAWDFIKIITNYYIISGIIVYVTGFILLIIALKYGELSVLYPIIGLSYVWVAIISVYVLGELMNVWKIVGIGFILAGVTFMGVKTKK